jgi:haloalkane dehalogenase
MAAERFDWLDTEEYPFSPHYLELPAGRMHYVDEGEGPPVLFLHGNPGWSFEYRKVMRELCATHRCIAPDHLGFGLSDKPRDWEYLPSQHAANVSALVEQLELEGLTLVVNDWGGPIGLSLALEQPERFRHLFITNSWMWSVRGDPYYRLFSALAGGPVGRFMIRYFNVFGRVIIRQCMADKRSLHPGIYRHLQRPAERKGCWTFPGQIVGASAWLDSLWQRRERLQSIPATLLWGMRDIAFREKELATWQEALPHAAVRRLEAAGHYPHEEAPEAMLELLRAIE